MAKFTLTIDMGNAAFEDVPGVEVAMILQRLATQLATAEVMIDRPCRNHLRDTNGNRVGEYVVTV